MANRKEASGAKRLVLGFDVGCLTCSDLARRIEEQVGDKLEICSLRDPQVQEWRRGVLGEDAPWAPTLIEIDGTRVRVWTGLRMGAQLGRFLGPVATWQIMQVLGEVGQIPKAEEASLTVKVIGSITRAQFLKGVGGAAVAMTILSGVGKFARPARAATITKTRVLDDKELVKFARYGARSEDMLNVGPGVEWTAGMHRSVTPTSDA